MNTRIARLGAAMLIGYVALFVQLNRVQVIDAARLKDHPVNSRAVERDFDRPRGLIVSADQAVLARSVPTPDGRFALLREYPEGDLFAHVTGHLSFVYGTTGIEASRNDDLAGLDIGSSLEDLSDLFVERDRSADVVLTLRRDVQQAARDALGAQRGAVVALDPRTGAVLALWSSPTYDPNRLASHDLVATQTAWGELTAADDNPMLARSYRERYFPGSTFKVVTAAAGLSHLLVSAEEPVYEPSDGYTSPAGGRAIQNFGGSTCGGSLIEILRVSCNTAFAEMAAETIGPDAMIETARAFGFDSRPPLGLPGVATSVFPTDYGAVLSGDGGPGSVYEDSARLAQAGIGQNDVQATPLQMALVAGAVANGGVIMEPYVVAQVVNRSGEVVEQARPTPWRTAMTPLASETLGQALVEVVTAGTATRAAIDGFTVGAKTGTAQLGAADGQPRSHAWVIAFAGPIDQPASVVVAVIVEAQEGASEQTGGRVAAPIAQAVLASSLAVG